MASQPPATPDQLLRVHCVKVFVRDQEQSLRFYLDQLGFRLVADTVLQSGERWLAVAPPDGDTVLALVAPAPDSGQYASDWPPYRRCLRDRRRRRSVQRLVAPRSQVPSVPKLRRIKHGEKPPVAPGTASDAEPIVWGGVFTRFKDIDGNSFSLVSLDEVTHAIEAERRAMRIDSKPSAASPRNSKSRNTSRPASFPRSCRPFNPSTTQGVACRRARSAATTTTSSHSVAIGSAWSSATSPAKASLPRFSWLIFRPTFAANAPWPSTNLSVCCVRSIDCSSRTLPRLPTPHSFTPNMTTRPDACATPTAATSQRC